MNYVTNTNTSGTGSLPQAMVDSNASGDDIEIQVSGTLTLINTPSDVPLPDISNDYTIDGTGYSFIIDINTVNEAFRVQTGYSAKLINVEMTNANRTSGYFLRLDSDSAFEFDTCTLHNNNSTSSDSAVCWSNGNPVSLTIRDCTITDAHSSNASKRCVGLGIDNTANVLTVINSTFTDSGSLRIDGGTVALSDSDFDNNGMTTGAPIITGSESAVAMTWNVTDCTFKNNSNAAGSGLYIKNYDGVTIQRCVFEGLEATVNYGGAIRISSTIGLTADVLIEDCQFKDNIADDNGGAVYIIQGSPRTFKFNRCSFIGNDVTIYDGGAVYARGSFQSTNKLEFENCTFDGNTSGRWGGVFRFTTLSNGSNFVNCTFRNNTCGSSSSGGVLYTDTFNGNTTMSNCLIYGNTANGSGNSFKINSGTLSGTYNSMDYDGSSSFTDGANNNEVGTGYTFDVSAAADNGGDVLTCAISLDSTAKDSGSGALSSEDYDARGAGFPRISGIIDRGAYEFQDEGYYPSII